MKRWTIAAITFALMASGLQAGASDTNRAMWVWDYPSSELVDFSTERGVDRLYLSAPPGFSSDSAYDVFLDRAHDAGIEVFALAGDPLWAKRSRPFIRWVDEVVAHGGFDGLAPDVEPYALSDWSNTKRRDRLISGYLRALDDVRNHAEALPVIPAVPFWWDEPEFAVKGNLLIDEVIERVDGIVVMAYRDTAEGPNGIIVLAQHEVSATAAAGKSVTIGVETAPNSAHEHVTFFEEGSAVMEAELADVAAEWSSTSSYWGNAIHHYTSYANLRP